MPHFGAITSAMVRLLLQTTRPIVITDNFASGEVKISGNQFLSIMTDVAMGILMMPLLILLPTITGYQKH